MVFDRLSMGRASEAKGDGHRLRFESVVVLTNDVINQSPPWRISRNTLVLPAETAQLYPASARFFTFFQKRSMVNHTDKFEVVMG